MNLLGDVLLLLWFLNQLLFQVVQYFCFVLLILTRSRGGVRVAITELCIEPREESRYYVGHVLHRQQLTRTCNNLQQKLRTSFTSGQGLESLPGKWMQWTRKEFILNKTLMEDNYWRLVSSITVSGDSNVDERKLAPNFHMTVRRLDCQTCLHSSWKLFDESLQTIAKHTGIAAEWWQATWSLLKRNVSSEYLNSMCSYSTELLFKAPMVELYTRINIWLIIQSDNVCSWRTRARQFLEVIQFRKVFGTHYTTQIRAWLFKMEEMNKFWNTHKSVRECMRILSSASEATYLRQPTIEKKAWFQLLMAIALEDHDMFAVEDQVMRTGIPDVIWRRIGI
jgi:hypothetical protein